MINVLLIKTSVLEQAALVCTNKKKKVLSIKYMQ